MSKEIQCDYLIIGQGLAGTLLAHSLLNKNKSVILLDEYRPSTASRVAAGLFHPVTGRRIVKSWMVETLYSFAREFYADQEKLLKTRFFFPKDLIEVISSPREFNVWTERLDDPGINQYLLTQPTPDLYTKKLQNFFKLISLSGAGWMDILHYLEASVQFFSKLQILESGKFELEKLEVRENDFRYRHLNAIRIVFCEGSDALKNPLWNWIPFLQSKGEIITILSEELPQEYILLKGLFIIPLGNHRFRVGSTYSWDFQDEFPSEPAKEQLREKLSEIISVPFEILEHKSGIRPTTKDRRPFIGEHPKIKNTFIFNGLGTKGVLLGPYFANEFANHLENGTEINEEVNIKRFYSSFQ